MLSWNFCDYFDYSGAYIVVKGDIIVTNPNGAKRNKSVAFTNNAPFINCISKINGVQVDNAEDLDVVMPMYNLLEYSKNYRKTTESILNYYRHGLSYPLSSNLLNPRQIYRGILIMLVMMKLIMLQIKLVKIKLKLLFHWNI